MFAISPCARSSGKFCIQPPQQRASPQSPASHFYSNHTCIIATSDLFQPVSGKRERTIEPQYK